MTDDSLLQADDIKTLRWELAFTSSDYREILAAYYIDERRVEDIARSLKMPKGTIVSKLQKNLQLAAYRTPSTAEELAIEIGVALPYVEGVS